VTDEDHFLSRWSRRKHAARKGEAPGEPALPVPAPAATSPAARATNESPVEQAPLPPLESLTPESDFSPFMRKDVDPALRRQALKTLLRDPRHNVMDGLDVYIDDYSKPDPIPPEWLGQLNQMARLGDHHATEARAKAAAEAQAAEARAEAPGEPGAAPIVAANQEVGVPADGPDPALSQAPSPVQESKHS
jgi:hypothetical protein